MTTLTRPSEPAGAPAALPPQAAGGRPRVLVVEDHPDIRSMLKTMLEMRGYGVLEAADGEQGVCVAERERPSLILMDATLPRLDGLAATRRIRALASLEGVPVVFLSGHAQPDFRNEALSSGAAEFLVKPVRLAELERVIERHLAKNAPPDVTVSGRSLP
ncbi:MAG: response regulator [Acidobacteria bacterium]|nr:response regulator [Acidobacteriota bacterium]